MKILLSLLLSIGLTAPAMAQFDKMETIPPFQTSRGTFAIETFEDDSTGSLPGEWYNRDGKLKPANHKEEAKLFRYMVAEEGGNKFLRYEGTNARHLNFPFINRDKENIYDINIYETPILSWKVRAHRLPQNANEDSKDKNDTVASIYVVFDLGRVALFKKVPKSIRYTWSTTLEEGTQTSKLFGNQNIIVVKSGESDTGKWITFERNVVEDYRRVFGDDPPKTPLAILILSDGDSTGSYVKADYDDIMLKAR